MGHSRDENKRDKIRERRRTLWFFHSRMNAPRDLTGIELSMLPEDIDHRIMPSGGTSRDWPDYRVAVEPYSKKAEEAVLLALAVDEQEHDLESALEEFFRLIVSYVLEDGEVFFEIVFDSDQAPRWFILDPLAPGRIVVFEGIVTQHVPPEEVRERGLKESYIEITESDTVWFTFPDSLGGKDGVLSLTADLTGIGSSIVPDFARSDLLMVNRRSGFDLGAFRELRDSWTVTDSTIALM
jgi:hypothetical protein